MKRNIQSHPVQTNQATPGEPAYRRAPKEKREQLLTAARELFATQGFDRTSTAQIARAASVSEGILFHHFGSKKGLFVALADEFSRDAAAVIMPSGDREVTEESIVRGAFDYADEHPALYDMLMNGRRELSEDDLQQQAHVLVDTIAQNLREAMAAGMIRRGNATVMAELQFALVDAAYKAWRRSGQQDQRNEFINEAATCMRAMLSPATTPQGRDTRDH